MWSGGRGLISVLSLLIVTPIVACYLIYDWNKMLAVVDHWVPPAQRDTVQTLAREVNNTIRRFVLDQGALCIILGLFYMVALSLIGFKHGILIVIAVPFAAAIGVLMRFAFRRYYASPFYAAPTASVIDAGRSTHFRQANQTSPSERDE